MTLTLDWVKAEEPHDEVWDEWIADIKLPSGRRGEVSLWRTHYETYWRISYSVVNQINSFYAEEFRAVAVFDERILSADQAKEVALKWVAKFIH